MSRHDELETLRQMRALTAEAIEMAEGRSRADLDENRMLQLALTRIVEVIGEAANRVSQATQDSLPGIPWRPLVGMRNRLIHAYDRIDLDVLWDTIAINLPDLAASLDQAIQAVEERRRTQ